MHDPDVVVFEVHVPIPRTTGGFRSVFAPPGRRWAVTRKSYRMPDGRRPMYAWWLPRAWDVVVAGRNLRWSLLLTVWHKEPDGSDSGTVCKGMGGSELTVRNVRWAARHRRHLRVQVIPVQRVRHYFERCDECGRRMGRAMRIGTGWDAPGVLHEECSGLRGARFRIADLEAYIKGEATHDQQFRVEYRLGLGKHA